MEEEEEPGHHSFVWKKKSSSKLQTLINFLQEDEAKKMDAELQELQRLFEQAQEAKPSVRLSDRNVVELVSKLQELHLLDADLLHTVSGKEYITQERLKEEIEGEVCRLGRVSLVDLAATLGVELIHCERQAQQIVGNNTDLSLVQGEILAATYWDSVAEEINETLQEAGQISVGELARQFNVGAELLTGVLGSRLGTLIQGKLEGGQLYTPTFVARIRAMVRGAVRALIIPTPLSTLWMSLQNQLREGDDGGGVGGVTGDGGLFQTILNQLIADGEVTGSLRGGNAMWTPAVFVVAQRESVEAFFSQNGYITYDALRKLTVPQPKQYLQAKYVDGIPLETVFVHSSIVSQLDAAAEEAIATNTWFDALPLLPPSFGISDVAKLVSLCPSVQRALKEGVAVILAETCMLSNTLIRSIIEKFENQAQELAQKKSVIIANVTKDAEDHSGTPPVGTELDADDGGDTTQGKNARRKKGSHGVGANKPMLETDLVSGKGGKGKKRGPKNKHAISGLAGELGISAPKSTKTSLSSKGGIAASEDDDIFSHEDLAAKILEWYPDMDTAGTDEGDEGILVRTLAERLRPIVVSAWLDAKHAIFSAQAEERRRRVDSLQLKIDEVYANFQLFAKALDLFLGEKSTEVILHRHLLRTTGAEIADLFLTAQAMEQKLEEGGDAETAQDSSESLSTSQRLSLAKSLPERGCL